MTSFELIQKKRDELQGQFDLISEKIKRLRKSLAVETQPAEKFQLEKQIEDDELEREKITNQLVELESKLSETYRVFVLSSAIDGKEIGIKLSSILNNNSIFSWAGTSNIDPYKGLEPGISKNIREASHIIVCITPDLKSPLSSLHLEISFALSLNKIIIPLIFNGGEKPLLIANYEYIAFSDWGSIQAILIERIKTPSPNVQKTEDQRNSELAYLQSIGQKYDHWRELYTDMHLSGRIKEQRVKVKGGAASKYLEMQHSLFKNISHDYGEDQENIVVIEEFSEIVEAIEKYKRVAIIGDPGSGKTTTLERLAYEIAAKAVNSENAPLPLYARLGAYTGDDILSFLSIYFDNLEIRKYIPNRIILFLDGLNEMPLEHLQKIDDWIRLHQDVPTIVTCRKLDYLERKLPLQRIDIAPLDVVRIEKFINNFLEEEDKSRLFWTLSGQRTREAWAWFKQFYPLSSFEDFWFGKIEKAHSYEYEKQQLKNIQDDLRNYKKLPGLLDLVTNPFLLFAVIQIFVRKGEPPTNRGQLFDQFVELLIEESLKKVSKPAYPWVNSDVQRQGLAKLAYEMQMQRTGTNIEKELAIGILNSKYPGQDANAILYYAINSGILIIERQTILRFAHQLLQEYFAAFEMWEDLRRGVPASKYWPSENWWEPTGWEETILLLAGIQGESSEVVKWLTEVNPTLAYRCAKESGANCSEEVMKGLYEPAITSRTSPLAKAEWGRILAHSDKGDHRPGVGKNQDGLPDIVWCEVPAGSFLMKGDPGVPGIELITEDKQLLLPYKFWISKYPITYSQYEPFVDQGYKDKKYWSISGWNWKGSQSQPRFWEDPSIHIPNHPVVGVTWYEAFAYTQWLNERLHTTESVFEGLNEWEVRLATEAEWEKAARYPDGRIYPWGNKYIPGHANVDETYETHECGPYFLRCATAVGMYPQGASPNGTEDLSGNVWEWCISKWKTLYLFPEDNDSEGFDFRVIRGGSWFNSAYFARTITRDHLDADLAVNDIGFRIVISCPIKNYPSPQ